MKTEMKLLFSLVCLAVSLSFLCPPCFASFNSGGIQGIIYDNESNSIAGAQVALYNENSSLVDYTLSLDDGFFSFQPDNGTYFMVVTFGGYSPKRSHTFYFDENSTLEVDVSLLKKPASLSDMLSDFWSNFGGIVAIGVSLFTFWLGKFIEKNRSKNERMKRIKSTISYPLFARVSSVLKQVNDLESAVKNFAGPKLNNEMEKIIIHLKSDTPKLENTLERILFEHELVSYLPEKQINEYHKIWKNLCWFSEFLNKDIGVIRASFRHYVNNEHDLNEEELKELFSSLKRTQENLKVTERC